MITKEELAKVVPPQEVIDQLQKIAKGENLSPEKVRAAFYRALSLDALNEITNIDDRCKQALYIMVAFLKAKLSSESKLTPMIFHVLSVSAPRTVQIDVEKVDPVSKLKIKMKEDTEVANIYGVFVGAGELDKTNPPKLGILSLWRDACEMLSKIRKNTSYVAKMSVKDETSHYKLSISAITDVSPSNASIPSAMDVIAKYYVPYTPSKVSAHLKSRNQMIHGRITKGWTRLDKNGKNRGYTLISDPNATYSKDAKNEDVQIMWSGAPEVATEYPIGTECYVLASIGDSTEQYGISIYGDIIIPIFIPEVDKSNPVWDEDFFGEETSEELANVNNGIPSPAANGMW